MKKTLSALFAVLMLTACGSSAAAPEPKASEAPAAETPAAVEEAPAAAEAELPAARDTSKKYTPSEGADPVDCTEEVFLPGCAAITNENLLDYLNRDDVLYIDLRDYADYAKKHFRNFECIPYFALIYSKEGGEGITQLYSGDTTNPVATYEESDELLEVFFPKDKTIFLMCQSGGRVAQLMNILNAKGYDMSKIYNITGMGNYTGSEFADITVDAAEIMIDAAYSFEGLTRVN
ncbi:MAG: rhodanese-like domain-containing protein [Solobacterium sp.]|nr:rhodanese-like domain-containing protein [Solobacterium sp.]